MKNFLKKISTDDYVIGTSSAALIVVLFASDIQTKLICLVLSFVLIIFYSIIEAFIDDDF